MSRILAWVALLVVTVVASVFISIILQYAFGLSGERTREIAFYILAVGGSVVSFLIPSPLQK